ncbi:hypothetical protein FF2_034649 [Malus domestica]
MPSGISEKDVDASVEVQSQRICNCVVTVPKVVPPPPLLPQPVMSFAIGDGYAAAIVDDKSAAAAASSQAKRVALQRKAATDMVAIENFARRFVSSYLSDTSRGVVVEKQAKSNVNVMCRICFCGENEGSEKARASMQNLWQKVPQELRKGLVSTQRSISLEFIDMPPVPNL